MPWATSRSRAISRWASRSVMAPRFCWPAPPRRELGWAGGGTRQRFRARGAQRLEGQREVGMAQRMAPVAWDIAVALGRPRFLPSSLAGQLFPAAQAVVEPLRAFAYAAAL